MTLVSHRRLALSLLGGLLLGAGCIVAEPGPMPSPPAAPPPQAEVAPPAPGPAYVWVPGHWAWRGRRWGYVWVPGRYAVPAQPGYVWMPAHWAPGPNGYVWVEGQWVIR
jgi:WXXGXW repeat (2 copies)